MTDVFVAYPPRQSYKSYDQKEPQVRAMAEAGAPYKVIAATHHITVRTISNWVRQGRLKRRYHVNR